jgi:hypothetical protein
MTTPKQHADSSIRLIELKAEIARLESQEATAEFWSRVTISAGLTAIVVAWIAMMI